MQHVLPAALLAACGLLASCGSGGPTAPASSITVSVTDSDLGDSFTYQAPGNFSPAPGPTPGYPQSAGEAAMLAAINAERARGGTCPDGTTSPPRAALTFEGHLHQAATGYARVLAASGSLDLPHRTGDSTPARRMVAAGFVPAPAPGKPLVFMESLAAGMTDPAEIITAWKTSVRHCEALYAEVPYGSVARADGQRGAYWVLNLAGEQR
ncbi:hypothetical protein Dcar01_02277 [Deinococcus carri]|uniref:SCP domain-containing protein n=1 Tax=Deinococcus carri TaxID=1211323 RepID=A0ABP9W861_9DEIO